MPEMALTEKMRVIREYPRWGSAAPTIWESGRETFRGAPGVPSVSVIDPAGFKAQKNGRLERRPVQSGRKMEAPNRAPTKKQSP